MKRLITVICVVALSLCLVLQTGAAQDEWDANVIFLALNDVPISLSDTTMPIRVGSTIYVPYFTFDANQNGGVRLGVFNGGQVQGRTLTLYNAESKNLTFDLRTGISYDYMDGGERQTPTAIIRNGQIYVSASSTARYFGLDYFQSSLTFGAKSYPFIRISSDGATLSNSMFLSSVSTTYLNQLQIYYQNSIRGQEDSKPQPTPDLPSETQSGGEEARGEIRVSMAIRCDTGDAGELILETVRNEGRGALFFFSPEQLKAQDDLVRRVIAEGNTIGLVTTSDDVQGAMEDIMAGNELLSNIAHTFTPIVFAENDSVSDALEEMGLSCWRTDLDGTPNGRGSDRVYSRLVQGLTDRDVDTQIILDDSQTSANVIERLMDLFQHDRYEYHMPVETSLG